MITPRQTRLLRVPDLQSFQDVLGSIATRMDPVLSRSCAFLLPSRAAAGELRHTLETVALGANEGLDGDAALPLPDLLTRNDWYQRLHERLRAAPPLLNEFEREVMMSAAAREAAENGTAPPFRLRAGLILEIIRLYDGLYRLQNGVDDFERLLVEDLESDADNDRGAARLLRQTQFLASTFRRYETKLTAQQSLDEHRLRQWLFEHPLKVPYTHIVSTMADCVAEREGLWPADFDLLTRLPLLARIDVVATEESLAAGFYERLHHLLPGIDEERVPVEAGRLPQPPAVLVPGNDAGERYFRSRDREDELSDLVRRLKQSAEACAALSHLRGAPAGLDEARSATSGRTAVVFRRPLPYIYLAREVFGSGGVPYQTQDALPLAAEPYAAALDLVFDFVSSAFSRSSTIALLRSPHFSFAADERFDRRAIALFDRKLSEAGYLGGLEQLRDLVEPWTNDRGDAEQGLRAEGSGLRAGSRGLRAQGSGLRAEGSGLGAEGSGLRAQGLGLSRVATAALAAARELASLLDAAPASRHLDTLRQFLRAHDRPLSRDDPARDRQLRGRAAIHAAIESLRGAHHRLDDRSVDFTEIVASLRRWIEGQTFSPRAGSGGVHLVDAQAARFGSFDDVHLVGLIDADWPDRAPRNIFFPPFLLQQHFGWPAESDRLKAVRGAFRDLLRLPHRRVSASTFALEDEAIVGPSVFLEDLETAGLDVVRWDTARRPRVFPFEAVSEEPIEPAPLSPSARTWLSLRQLRTDRSAPIFHGSAGACTREAYAVGALETFLECPFKFFAKHVLVLDEEQLDEDARRPRVQGIFLHRVFQAFFEEWNRMGHGAISVDNLGDARAAFGRVVEPLLAELPAADAALERNRLFGNAAAEGLAEIVFRIEAECDADVVERLLEHRLEGAFDIQGATGPRRVTLSGVADRIDLLEDGTLRVIDYKSGRPPSAKRMLQLPVYSVCASQQLDGRHGRSWTVGDGGYIAFKDARRFVPLAERGTLDRVLQEAQTRLLNAVDQVEAGKFPPTPIEPFRCTFCAYSGVCRKDYVGDE